MLLNCSLFAQCRKLVTESQQYNANKKFTTSAPNEKKKTAVDCEINNSSYLINSRILKNMHDTQIVSVQYRAVCYYYAPTERYALLELQPVLWL